VAKRRRREFSSPAEKAESTLASYLAGSLVTEESSFIGRVKDGDGWSEVEVPFVWRRLSVRGKQAAIDAATKRFRELEIPPELRSYADWEEELALQVLHRAMRDPGDPGTDSNPFPKTLANTADELGEFLDEDTRDLLAIEYRDFEDEHSPDNAAPSQAELDALESAIEKKDLRVLNSFGPRTLRHWLLTSARLHSS
jgi:hypothetical protein